MVRVDDDRMTDEQRRLVEENMGLVGLHIRRHVGGLDRPTRDREWDDLFQEGCLGLVRAAKSFDAGKGVSFSAYAMRRIQAAVHQALGESFATVRVPVRARRGQGESAGRCGSVRTLEFDPPTRAAEARHHPCGVEHAETIGVRIREKYDHAVREAVRGAESTGSSDLLSRIVEERLLVPNTEQRVPLRQIAREQNSSYARTAYAEKRLRDDIRLTLTADPELDHLCREARRSEEGFDTPVDGPFKFKLDAMVRGRFRTMYRRAAPCHQASILAELLPGGGDETNELAERLFDRLSDHDKTAMFTRWTQHLDSAMDMTPAAAG